MSSEPGVLRRLWFRWKTLKLPWRRQYLVGFDLAGNTFWEFKDQINANRLRRIAKYSRRTHYADVRISPQWYQWLRHTRDEAPTIQEQQFEVSRQEMMKQRALEADERWKSQPSYLDSPSRQQPTPAVAPSGDVAETVETLDTGAAAGTKDEAQSPRGGRTQSGSSPWDNPPRGAPSQQWQPESWTPGKAQRR